MIIEATKKVGKSNFLEMANLSAADRLPM